MTLLITKAIAASKLQIAIGYDENEFNVFIRDAQRFDLKPILREDFYNEVLANKTEQPFVKLIEGGTYSYDGKQYEFEGLSAVLSYFTYARYYLDSSGVNTSHGVVVKTTPNSQPVALEDRRNVYYKKREEANILFEDCKKFIERNASDYPGFYSNTGCGRSSRGGGSTHVIQ